MKKLKGFTLLELLVTLTITSILVSIAAPSFRNLINKNKVDTTIDTLFRAYQLSRYHAVTTDQKVYLCGSDDGVNCQNQWSKMLIAFTDKDKNRQPAKEEIIGLHPLDLDTAHIRTRLALGKSYTIMKPDGSASFTGSFIYCPDNNSDGFHHRLTWNKIGRPYEGVDFNNDGYIDDTNGKSLKLACK